MFLNTQKDMNRSELTSTPQKRYEKRNNHFGPRCSNSHVFAARVGQPRNAVSNELAVCATDLPLDVTAMLLALGKAAASED